MYLKQVVNWKSVLSLFLKSFSNKREIHLDYLKVYGIYVVTCTCKNTNIHFHTETQSLSHKSWQKHAPIQERELNSEVDVTVNDQLFMWIQKHDGSSEHFFRFKRKDCLPSILPFSMIWWSSRSKSRIVVSDPQWFEIFLVVSLLKPTILQADEMSLLCLEMFRNDMRALWLSDFVFLSLFFLSHSLICPTYLFPSSLKHVSLMKSKTKRGLVLQ